MFKAGDIWTFNPVEKEPEVLKSDRGTQQMDCVHGTKQATREGQQTGS